MKAATSVDGLPTTLAMCTNKQIGFTLTELVIALAVLGIVASIAAPSFSESLQSARLSSNYNDMVGAMQLARSEAVKRNVSVGVCASNSVGDACGVTWSDGAIVYVDNLATVNDLDSGEEILRLLPAVKDGTDIVAFGSTSTSGAASFINRTRIRFMPSGNTSWRGGGAIQLCDKRGTKGLRALLINLGGDIRRAHPDQHGVTITQWGATLECKT